MRLTRILALIALTVLGGCAILHPAQKPTINEAAQQIVSSTGAIIARSAPHGRYGLVYGATGGSEVGSFPNAAQLGGSERILADQNGNTVNILPTQIAQYLGIPNGLSFPLSVANGGNGTATPSLIGGTNCTVTGSWPDQTISCSGGGSGTVTSVGLSLPSWLSVSGSPVTGAGTLAVTATGGLTANEFLATPNGSSGALGLRAITDADVPGLPGTPTNGQFWGYNGSAQGWYTPAGSGTVNSGTSGDIGCYTATGTAISGCSLGAGLAITSGVLNPAMPQRTVTGTTDTISCSTDNNGLIIYDSASAVAVTIPQATGSCSPSSGFLGVTIINIGAGAVTLTPTTSTINGLTSITAAQYTGGSLVSDGTNYVAANCTACVSGGGSSAFSSLTSGENNSATMTVGPSAVFGILGASGTGYTNLASANTSSTNYTATFPANSGTVAELGLPQSWGGASQSFSGEITDNLNPGGSTAPINLTGNLYTAGTGTTNFPYIYYREGGGTPTPPTTFSSGGTALGMNLASGFSGNFVDLYINGTEIAKLSSAGTLFTGSVVSLGAAFTLGTGTGACATDSVVHAGPSAGEVQCTGSTGASTLVVNLPTATNGWACSASDITAKAAIPESAFTTASVTFSGSVTANDNITVSCQGF